MVVMYCFIAQILLHFLIGPLNSPKTFKKRVKTLNKSLPKPLYHFDLDSSSILDSELQTANINSQSALEAHWNPCISVFRVVIDCQLLFTVLISAELLLHFLLHC